MKPFRFAKRFIGGLNKDANVNDLPPNDFIDGYDIVDRSTQVENEDGFLQPAPNTVLAYDLGEAEATAKVYRVTMDLTGLGDCDILFNATINGLFYNYEITPVSYTTGDDAATLFSNIETIFNGVPNYDDTIFTLVFDTDFLLVFDIAIPFYGYTDYILSVENSLGDSYDLQVLTDAVSVDKEGRFYPVRFENINNDQQVFATTNTKKPQTLVADATYTSALFLEFAADPEINDGDEVYIYSLTGGVGQISAIVTLRDGFAPLTYEVVGTSNVTISPSGSYAVVKNIRSLSVIGYAKKNNILNEWNYTELLRSNKLNFRAYNQIQGALNVTSDAALS